MKILQNRKPLQKVKDPLNLTIAMLGYQAVCHPTIPARHRRQSIFPPNTQTEKCQKAEPSIRVKHVLHKIHEHAGENIPERGNCVLMEIL